MGLESPIVLHRNLLEAQREVIVALKRFETIHVIRRDKLREFLKLRRLVNQTGQMILTLKGEFPHVEGRLAHRKEKTVEERSAPVRQTSQMTSSEEAELHRLERELGEIESKLRHL